LTNSTSNVRYWRGGRPFRLGRGGLVRRTGDDRPSRGEIYLPGAHVTRFQPHRQKPVLFVEPPGVLTCRQNRIARRRCAVLFPAWFGTRKTTPKPRLHGTGSVCAYGMSSPAAADRLVSPHRRVHLFEGPVQHSTVRDSLTAGAAWKLAIRAGDPCALRGSVT